MKDRNVSQIFLGPVQRHGFFMYFLTTDVYITSFLLPGFRELKTFIVQICGAAPVYRL
jgi:hypothetical protein